MRFGGALMHAPPIAIALGHREAVIDFLTNYTIHSVFYESPARIPLRFELVLYPRYSGIDKIFRGFDCAR
ncbi:hypothetical protein CFB35_16455 [Burkholderia sp. AU16482]|nr:hypothetical protein CFB35_16455 [Burkholderia sp. AU16482]